MGFVGFDLPTTGPGHAPKFELYETLPAPATRGWTRLPKTLARPFEFFFDAGFVAKTARLAVELEKVIDT